MTTNQTIDGVPRELVRENIAYLRGMGGTHDQRSALAAKFELLLLDHAPAKDLREQYETWADSNGYDITRNEHGDYAGIVEDSMWTGWQARGELRALLDAKPAEVTGDDVLRWMDEHAATQPQGEPVARVEIGADRNAALTVTDDDWLRSLKDRGVHQIVSLYAERPAPMDTLKTVLTSLKEACESGVVIDTLWLTGPCSETLFDYLERMIEANQPAPVAVVLPERMIPRDPYDSEANQWNACLDEVLRLNGNGGVS